MGLLGDKGEIVSRDLADVIVAIIGFLFAVILIPQVIDSIRGRRDTNPITSSLMAAGVFTVAIVFFLIKMPWIAVSNILMGIMWTILFVCSIVKKGCIL